MGLSSPHASAEFSAGGSLDFYYGYNFNTPPPVAAPTDAKLAQPAGQNMYRVFDIYHDDMALALAEAHLKHVDGPVGAYVSVGAGHTADVLSPRDEVSKHVLEAYVTYEANERWSFIAGKMTTHLGLEYTKSSENWQYSRSVLFGYALPFWHTGVGATYEILPKELSASAFLYNETSGLYETNRGKTAGAQLKWKPREHDTYALNLLSGPEISDDGISHVRRLIEVTGAHRFDETWSVAADAVFGQLTRGHESGSNAQWFAWSAAVKYNLNAWIYLSPRVEFYFDRSGVSLNPAVKSLAALPQAVDTLTFTLGADLGRGLKSRFEVRRDHSSTAVFMREGVQASDNQITALVALLMDVK